MKTEVELGPGLETMSVLLLVYYCSKVTHLVNQKGNTTHTCMPTGQFRLHGVFSTGNTDKGT